MRDREYLTKFDTRSSEGIFLGYSNNSRAYRVFNLENSTIMESANIMIDESSTDLTKATSISVSTDTYYEEIGK